MDVSDDDDSLVRVRVVDIIVAEGVSPWIAHRRDGWDVDTAVDIAQRSRFYAFLEAAISAAVMQARR